jgi:hypothetical protein
VGPSLAVMPGQVRLTRPLVSVEEPQLGPQQPSRTGHLNRHTCGAETLAVQGIPDLKPRSRKGTTGNPNYLHVGRIPLQIRRFVCAPRDSNPQPTDQKRIELGYPCVCRCLLPRNLRRFTTRQTQVRQTRTANNGTEMTPAFPHPVSFRLLNPACLQLPLLVLHRRSRYVTSGYSGRNHAPA